MRKTLTAHGVSALSPSRTVHILATWDFSSKINLVPHPHPLKAVGLGVRFIKLGGLSRGERVTKYNRLLTIEEELVQNGALGTCWFPALFALRHE